ncbi:SusC/RagA family TonB-linked outer membrane protein [Zunongwangia sp.]|uniref:SusC/RagA family TonB-linked outer membrane protein n=1 Tax=Zunongwangia sp. TaxID=1965325 RepID=UPI003AA9574E
MKLKLITLFVMLISVVGMAQDTKTISGVVIDTSDVPLPGAQVKIIGKNIYSVTDFDGNFTLEGVSEGDTFRVTFLGFQAKEMPVTSETQYNVVLQEEASALSEVVVIGYGQAESRDLAGTISNLKAEEINDSPTTSALQAAQGKLPGVQIINNGSPGSVGNVRIRGSISVLGGANPLYVVDGVITNDISGIDNSDIESFDVLKDASSTAIYGARGANGVIIITTKSGKGKMNISLSTTTGINTIVNSVDMANAQQYATYTNEALARGGNDPAFTPEEISNLSTTDWMDKITQDGFYQKYNFSISGSKEDALDYYASVNYMDEEGILKGNKYERLTVRLNNTYHLSDKIRIGHNLSLIRERGFNPSTSAYDGDIIPYAAFTNAYKQAPTFSVRNENGNYARTILNDVGNPVAEIENNQSVNEQVKILGNVWGEIDLFDWLTFRSSLGVNVNRQKIRAYGARYVIENESSTQINNQNQQLSVEDKDFERFNWDNFFTIDKKFGRHDFQLNLGLTSERLTSEYLKGSRRGVPPSDNLLYLGIGEQEGQTLDNGGDKSTRLAYFSRLLYNFDKRYVFNATIRREGSSKFSDKERIKYYPSFGLAWNIDNEDFFDNQNVLSNLKLRGSYGLVGNDRIDSGQFLQLIDFVKYPFPSGVAIGGTSIEQYDQNLKWETTKELDLGLEFAFLDNRLTGEFTYYKKQTEDILFPLALPETSGDDSFITNAGDIENKGVEVALAWSDRSEDGDFSYNIGFNLTSNQNELTAINPVIENSTPFIESGSLNNGKIVTRTVEGKELGTFWLYKTNGVFTKQSDIDGSAQPNAKVGDFRYVDTDGNGAIDQNDRQFMGSYQPDFYYGINLGVTYKQVDFSTSLFGNVGNKVYNGLRAQRFSGENIDAALFADRYQGGENPNSGPAAFNEIPLPSDYYLEDGDFLRVNNITIGYNFSDKILETIKLSKLRVYATAQNPFTFTDYSGFNPELPRGVLDSGLELDAYPTTAKFLLGLNIDF